MIRTIRKPRFLKIMSVFMAILFINEIVFPTVAMALTGGPSQPEVESFAPIEATDMVDLFSGDFKYNIPLMDVDGYPININYNSNITMDQEASWVGLGWNLNPGVINRSMRGLPDDFCGDLVTKEFNLKEDITIGIRGYVRAEVFSKGFTPSLGYTLSFSTKNGFSLAQNIGLTKSLSSKTAGKLTFGLNLNRSSNKGATFTPNVSYSCNMDAKEKQSLQFGLNAGFPINSVGGLKSMQLGFSATQTDTRISNGSKTRSEVGSSSFGGDIGFGIESYTPQISMPIKNFSADVNVNIGTTILTVDGFVAIGANYNEQSLSTKEVKKPAFGYMYSNIGYLQNNVLLDFNRDKDVPYYEGIPVLPISNKTYDVYSILGQGISGSFRGMENIGGMTYNDMSYNTGSSGSLGLELGGTSIVKGGLDETGVISNSESSLWQQSNFYTNSFRSNSDIYQNTGICNPVDYEPLVFKMIGEATPESHINFINNTGKFNPVRLYTDKIGTTSFLSNQYVNQFFPAMGSVYIEPASKQKRGNRLKRNQYVHTLNARDAQRFGLESQIKVYKPDFNLCQPDYSIRYDYTSINRSNYKWSHTSEIRIDKTDGSRYVYGIPAYVTKQIEASFSVDNQQNDGEELVAYTQKDDSKENEREKDNYYQKTILPPYAHSYLLTAVLSPDYIDRTADGPTDDDLGNYVKFNYRNLNIENNGNPFKWRTPSEPAASYNEGFLYSETDSKGSYVYGEKEIWYIHSIETKNYIVEFELTDRKDGYGVLGTQGGIDFNNKQIKKISEIRMYSKKERLQELDNAVPIKTVHFVYDYSLCKGIPNNNKIAVNLNNLYENEIDNQWGKLTLKKVYFTYGKSNKGKLNPYEFKYCYNNDPSISQSSANPYNPDYHIKGYDRWGFYKPKENTQLGTPLFSYEFPYVDQRSFIETPISNVISDNNYCADVYSSAWNLTNIKLPSGGEFNVTYESDDYAYVQNQRAMQMGKLLGFSDDVNKVVDITNNLYTSAFGLLSNTFEICYFKLPKAVSAQDFKKLYLEDQKELYFRARVNINSHFKENISGYAKIDSNPLNYGVCGTSGLRIDGTSMSTTAYEIGWIKVSDFDLDNENPVSAATWRFCMENEPSFINGKNPVGVNPNLAVDFFLSLNPLSLINDLVDAFRSPWSVAKKNDIAITFDPAYSWVRLQNPVYCKKGGGSRVKKIVIGDNWNQDVKNYGQEYEYTTDAPNGVDLPKISSGVAAYEPQVGGDENPIHKPLYYKTSGGAFQPDNYSYLETPIGEAFYPAPTVGYSKITIKTIYKDNLNNDVDINKRHKNGITVHEFFTAKDFPVKDERTPISEVNSKTGWFENMFAMYTYNKVAVSQGFVIRNNDMHGKPKSVKNYSNIDLLTPISGEDYYYDLVENNPYTLNDPYNANDPNKYLAGNELNNYVNIINKDASPGKNLMGVDYEIYNDFRENHTRVQKTGSEVNLTFFTLGIIPVIIPPVWFTYSEDELQFRSAVTTKAITTYGILKDVVKYDQSSRVKTSNLKYDAETGDILLTKTQNAFNDKSYSFKYPAHWAYKGMGPASVNTNVVIRNFNFTNKEYQNSTYDLNTYFVPGDEVMLFDKIGANDVISFNSGYKKGWVLYVKDNAISIVDQLGRTINTQSNFTDIKVINSGRKNQPMDPIGSIVSKEDPTSYLQTGTIDQAGIIQSEAVEYDNTRKIYSEYFKDTCKLRPTLEMADLIYFLNDLISQNKLINNIGINTTPLSPNLFNININNFNSFSNLLKSYILNGTTDWVGRVGSIDDAGMDIGFRKGNGDLEPWMFLSCSPGKIKNLRKILYIKPHNWDEPCSSTFRFRIGSEYYDELTESIKTTEDDASLGTYLSPFNLAFESYIYYSSECGGNKETVNPFISGIMGNWYPRTSYKYLTVRNKVQSTTGTQTNLRSDGDYKDFVRFWQYNNGKWEKPSNLSENWKWTNTITIKDNFGNEVENKNPLNIYSAALYGYNDNLPVAVANNTTHKEIVYENFEEFKQKPDCQGGILPPLMPVESCNKHFPINGYTISNALAHTGRNSMNLSFGTNPSTFQSYPIKIGNTDVEMITYNDINTRLIEKSIASALNQTPTQELKMPMIPEQIKSLFSPQPSGKYLISLWLNTDNHGYEKIDNDPLINKEYLKFESNNNEITFNRISVGEPIEGWQKIVWEMNVSPNATNDFVITFKNQLNTFDLYIDDFRISPLKSSMKSYVYDDVTKRFIAELDENNYATFYEYDEDGALVRVKKETEKGIFTIKEVRKNLKK